VTTRGRFRVYAVDRLRIFADAPQRKFVSLQLILRVVCSCCFFESFYYEAEEVSQGQVVFCVVKMRIGASKGFTDDFNLICMCNECIETRTLCVPKVLILFLQQCASKILTVRFVVTFMESLC